MPLPFALTRKKDYTDLVMAADINDLQAAVEEMLVAGRLMEVLANPGAATLTTVGFAAAPTASGTASSADGASGPFVRYTSAATSGSVAGLNSAAAVCRRDWLVDIAARIAVGATITSVRYWVGLFSASPTGSATPAAHLAAFRYDTGADTTAFWRCCTDDGGAAPTVTVTNVAVTASTAYDLRIRFKSGSVEFYVNGVEVAEHTTDLPAASTMLSWYTTVTTLTAAARTVDVSRVMVAHR
jgi:hypothetical protein